MDFCDFLCSLGNVLIIVVIFAIFAGLFVSAIGGVSFDASTSFDSTVESVSDPVSVAVCDRFEYIGKQVFDGWGSDPEVSFYFYRDLSTDVVYVWSSGYRKGSFTVMLSADGSPLLYSEWLLTNIAE